MKPLAILLGLCAIPALAQDIRTVSNVAVDLTPIHKWQATHEGERPMKHWKDIKVLEVTGKSGVWNKVRIAYDGEQKEVLLANSEKIVAVLNELKGLPVQIAYTEDWISRAGHGLQQAEANAQAYNYNPNTSGVAYVPRTWYGSVDDARAALDKLKERQATLEAQANTVTADLAMYTGKKYGAYEIWDIGKRKQ